MFAFFKNDTLENFWANKVGDIFFDLTVRGMKWDQSQVDLNFYFGLDNVPAFYEFDAEKNLIIKKEVVTFNEVVTQNGLGEEVVTQEEVRAYVIDKTISPIVYAAKGVIVKPC